MSPKQHSLESRRASPYRHARLQHHPHPPPAKPGASQIVARWLPRDTLLKEPLVVLNPQSVHSGQFLSGDHLNAMAWCFHYDDVDPQVVAADFQHANRFPSGSSRKTDYPVPPWSSGTYPGAVGRSCVTPGTVAPEAAAVLAPVLIAMENGM